jgi:hypothetical protein
MSVPASKVKQVCTAAEAALVRNSRKPALETLSAAQLKQSAIRARKLVDKWQGQARGQSRRKGRETGASGKPANTELKMQIFREALEAFEGRLAKMDGAGKGQAAKSGPSKKARAAEHRARRAAVRKGMTAVEDLVNAGQPTKAVAPTPPPAAPAENPAEKPAKKTPKFKTPVVDKAKKAKPPASAQPQLKKEPKTFAVAKQARVAASGRTTRFVGHITSRGRKAQARRDSKNP